MIHYYTIDTETTGLSIEAHEIVEISVIRCSDKVQISRTIKAEKPYLASLDALAITNKTIEDLKKGISKEQAVADIHNFFTLDNLTPAHRCLIGHNVSFDRRFLHCLWSKLKLNFPCDLWMDTMAMTRTHAKNNGIIKPRVDLDSSISLLSIASKGISHTAKGDARNTFLLWDKLMKTNINHLDFIKRIPHTEPDDE